MGKSVRIFGLTVCALALGGQSSPSADDPLTLIKAHVRPIERDRSGAYSGESWNALVADAAGAQFVMVGEQHGSGDIARFEAALHRELARRGFTHSGLEVGPYSTEFAERLVRSGKGKLQSYIAAPGHGFSLPFLVFGEEAEMAEQMVASSSDKSHALFGLDQEFVGAGPILATELRDLATSDGQRKAAADFAAAAAKDPMLVAKMEDEGLSALERAFQGNARALAIVDAMRVSARIYAPYFSKVGSTYASNLERETYMKTNLVRQFEAAEKRNGKAPKVFFKFGGYHAMRGLSGTNVPSLANFLAEWGLPRNYRLVNLMVDCIGGEALNPQTGKAQACEPYFPSDGLLYKAVADGPRVQIVDLRALRPQLGRLKGVDEATRKNILAFDYYVAIKGGAAATPLARSAG
jgi:hypothetical protein